MLSKPRRNKYVKRIAAKSRLRVGSFKRSRGRSIRVSKPKGETNK